ncbi:MAG: hypothetical protein HYX96_08340 [Chloroflexi bacterium]|nr:hypothetical protein [Chloroflexota bacterium]
MADNNGLNQAYRYPLFEALVRRRTRRFGLGFELDGGPLKYKSASQPVALTAAETALLCYAGAGTSGLIVGDGPYDKGNNSTVRWSARTFPNPCNYGKTGLIFTDDAGVYLYKPREATKPIEIENIGELEERLTTFDRDIVKLKDGRIDLPPGSPALFAVNQAVANRPGQTVFMPVINPTFEWINLALLCIQYGRWQIVDDDTRQPAGIESWVPKLNLKLKVPISSLDVNVMINTSLEAAFIGENILHMAEAMGLGGYPLSGYAPVIIMGGTPITKGLGFHYVADKKGRANPVGIDGVLQSYSPPYFKDMGAAVDAVVAERFGPGKIYSPDACPSPLRDQATFAQGVDRQQEDIVQCVKDLCRYIYDKYGRFPATFDTMTMPIWVCAHHIDLDFYDRYYQPEMVNETHWNHMALWHPA